MESGSSKQRHLAPTQAKAGRLQLPKSSFNGWNHESRQSVFQIESMSPGSSWFFMPVLTVFTVKKKKRDFFHIQGSFLSFFFFFFVCLPHPHTWTIENPLKQSKFDSTDVSTAHSLYLSEKQRSCFLLSYCSFWRADSSWGLNLMKCFYIVQYSEMCTRINWSRPAEILISVIKQRQYFTICSFKCQENSLWSHNDLRNKLKLMM